MRIAEHRRHLLAQADEVVDVEEAPIVDLVGRDAPERQAIGLAFEQLMQRAEALGRAGPTVIARRGAGEPRGDRRVLRELGEGPLPPAPLLPQRGLALARLALR